jgi:predicted phage terminase large subunit-like protein
VGVDSSIQGFGGDCIIYDDPNSVKDIWSQARQQSVINFHKVSIRNRANTSKTTWVLVQQRLGTKDFTQYIMSEKGWFHLIIPTEYTKHYTFKSPIGRNDPRKKDGELVWPERFDKEFYEEEKKNQWVWQSIYQQNPVNLDGNTIKKDWLKYSNAQPESDYYDQIILSIDLAIEETDTADYSAFLVIGQKTDPSNPFKSLFYIHEWHKDKLSFPDIVKKVQELTLKYKKSGTAFSRIIEKKGIGKALLDVLSKNEDTTDIIPVVPSKSKLERLLSVQMLFINDCVIFPNPENAPTIQGVIDELLAFPKGEHDDYVDALSQGLNWLFLNQRGLSTNVYIPSSDNTEISLFSVSSGTDFSTVNPFRQTDNTTTLKKLFK